MTTWKTCLALSLLIAIAALLYPHHTTPPNLAGKTTIVFWGELNESEAVRTALEDFERQYPNYHVDIGTATHPASIGDATRFLLSVAGDDPPDVMGIDRLVAVELGTRGAFADLNPYIEQDQSRPDGVHQADYYGPLWNETCYQGHQYAVSYGANARALYLNDDYLIRAGFVNPDGTARPPKSWEDICRKIYQGAGTVTSAGLVHPIPNIQYPISNIRPGDVVTLAAGSNFFRARIKTVSTQPGENAFTIDFTRDLAPDIHVVPAVFVHASRLEIKVFDQNSYAVALTRFDARGNLDILGFTPLGGNSWFFNYAWQYGATFMSPDGRHAALDDPKAKAALQFMVDCYDCMGGYQIAQAFEDSHNNGDERSPFIVGKVAMIINGSWFLNYIAIFRSDFRFTAIPPPLPQAQLDAGVQPFTWIGGGAFVMPANARHPRAAWDLMRFLVSRRGRQVEYEVDAARYRAAGQLFVPDLPPRPDMLDWVRDTYLAHNPALSQSVLHGFDVSAGLLPHAMFRVPTPVSNKLFECQKAAAEKAMSHSTTVDDSLATQNSYIQESLDRYFHPPTGPVVNWWYLLAGYLLLLTLGAVFLARHEIRRRNAGFGHRHWKAGFTCVSPWLLGFVIFGGGPILFSLIISFCRYDILHPAQFIGLQNYLQLLGFHTNSIGHLVPNDPMLFHALANTAFMLIGLPLSICLGLLLALALAAQFRGIAVFRTLFYLPTVVPAVASFLLWAWIFNPTRGLLNSALLSAGVNHPPLWLSDAAWAKPAIILMGLWGVGGGMLIWLAGLKAIPLQLYEAAEIDGAGPLRQFFNVTLPMLSPYIFFNTVMGVIGTLQVFESAFIMTEGGPDDSTLFYCYYLFNQAFRYLDMGAASAMAWILFLLVLALTLFQLHLSKKWVHYD